MAYFQRSPLADRDVEQVVRFVESWRAFALYSAITSLKKGAYLLKYGRRGKPKFFPFRLSTDETALIWYQGKSEKQIKLRSVSRIVPGQRTAVFQRYPQPQKEYQSFSLMYGERSLDLICKDKEEAEVWITALQALIKRGNTSQSRSEYISSDNTKSPSRKNSAFNVPSSSCGENKDKDEGESRFIPVSYGSSRQSRLGKAFSEVLSHVAVGKSSTLADTGSKHLERSFEDTEDPPTPNSGVDSFQGRSSSALSLSSQGSSYVVFNSLCDIYIWGEGAGNGVLGGGAASALSSDASLPKLLQSNVALDAHTIACGVKHAVLVTKQGQIFSWGEESGGRLGHGSAADVSEPKIIDAFGGMAIQVAACGEFHTCAVTLSGDLYVWGGGNHNHSLLGLDSEVSHWKPVRVYGQMDSVNVSNISCGPWHSAFVTTAGQLFTFGDGTFGALGHGGRSSTRIPREIDKLKGLRTTRTSCGVWHTAAVVELTSDNTSSGSSPSGKLFTWGDNDKGQLGHGDKKSRLVPHCVSMPSKTDFQQVACGENITIALTVSGELFCMGVVDQAPGNSHCLPTRVAGRFGHSHVDEVACGSHHIAVLSSKAEVYTWGKGKNGQLGHGDRENREVPTLVRALKYKQVKRVVCGSNFTVAICLHKPISSDNNSACAGCHNPFNFRRKHHNCYNCGKIFCKACASKRSTKAAMAPDASKPFRVCDECYDKLDKSVVSPTRAPDEKATSNPKSFRRLLRLASFESSRLSLDSKFSGEMDSKVDTSSVNENSLACTARLSYEVAVKDPAHSRSSFKLLRLNSFDSLKPQTKLSKSNMKVSWSSDTVHVARHSVASYIPGSQRVSTGISLPLKSSPSPGYSAPKSFTYSDIPGPEFMLDGSKESSQSHAQEIAILKAQLEDLTRKSQQLETELERTSRKVEEATRMAEEEAEKNKSSKVLIEGLTMQLIKAAGRESYEPIQLRKSV